MKTMKLFSALAAITLMAVPAQATMGANQISSRKYFITPRGDNTLTTHCMDFSGLCCDIGN